MPIDYGRVLVGLDDTADMISSGAAGLPVINRLIEAAQQATGAAGATFIEFGPGGGGRVVAAAGAMAWALGQPIEAEFVAVALTRRSWAGRIDLFPTEISEPLLACGLISMAGYSAYAAGRVRGAVHVYFTGSAGLYPSDLPVLGVIAHAAGQIHADAVPEQATLEEEAADDRDLFLAVTGHELRTPVTVIKGYASTLADRWEALTERNRREAVQTIAQRADELARLVDRLLAASGGAPVAGRLTRPVPFDLVDTVLKAASELPVELRRSVRLAMPDGLPLAYGVPASLTSILAELVTNAVRYGSRLSMADLAGEGFLFGQPPGVEVEVFAGADARTVFFQVCDRGMGIDPAHAELAFARFWQGSRAGRSSRGGVGLGLYLVRRLVERQNGWVSLRPRDGGGTIAEVRLPRADGPRRPVAPGEA